jgi:hypothetical protein
MSFDHRVKRYRMSEYPFDGITLGVFGCIFGYVVRAVLIVTSFIYMMARLTAFTRTFVFFRGVAAPIIIGAMPCQSIAGIRVCAVVNATE